MLRTQKETVKLIRKLVKQAGYEYYFTYNDKRANGDRRIKMMRNGHDFGNVQHDDWNKVITALFTQHDIKVKSAGFEVLHRYGYGPYKAYVVVI